MEIKTINFEAKVSRPSEGGDWTFLHVPKDASDQLRTRSMISVDGTMNGFPFIATLQPDGVGGHWLKIDPRLAKESGVAVGDEVELEISPVTVEPEPDVPDDLREALAITPMALAVWTDITPIARRDWISWMTSGKKAETRTLRLGKMMDMLAKGKRRACCFDRSGMYSNSMSCPTAASDV